MQSNMQVSTGLTCLHKNSELMFNKTHKDIVEAVGENFNLKITIATNSTIVTFLNFILDICTRRYQDQKRPNDTSTDINVSLNDRRSKIKALPDNLSKRISNISSDKAIFDNAATLYDNALPVSGYEENITFQKDLQASNRVSQRKTIRLNPPW